MTISRRGQLVNSQLGFCREKRPENCFASASSVGAEARSVSTKPVDKPAEKLLAESSSDTATIHANSIANLLRTETVWLCCVMRIGTS